MIVLVLGYALLELPSPLLTLFGTGEDIFIPLSLLDQILSADFLKTFPNFFGGEIYINRVILTPCPAH